MSLETDKVNVEVPAPLNGNIRKISVKEGETVNVGALLGSIVENLKLSNKNYKEEKEYTPPSVDKKKIEKDEIKRRCSQPLVLQR